MKPIARSFLLGGLTALLGAAVFLAAFWIYFTTKDYAGYFTRKHGTFSGAVVETAGGDSLFTKHWVKLRNTDGFTVTCGMLAPRDQSRRYPAVILMGGKATGKYAVDYALGIRDIVLIAIDYAYEPREDYTLLNILADVPDVREAIINTVPAAMLALDFLSRRPDVDTTKIVMLGYSFGAPFVPAILAHDRRPAVAAMVYGGGDVRSMVRHNVRRYRGPLMSEFVGTLGGVLLHAVEPMRYADRISPIPLIMINGSEDEQIPKENTELFFNAAHQPKKIVWLDSRHVNPRNVELTRLIVGTLTRELEAAGILGPNPLR
jgi:dienelactone hydrolase